MEEAEVVELNAIEKVETNVNRYYPHLLDSVKAGLSVCVGLSFANSALLEFFLCNVRCVGNKRLGRELVQAI